MQFDDDDDPIVIMTPDENKPDTNGSGITESTVSPSSEEVLDETESSTIVPNSPDLFKPSGMLYERLYDISMGLND